MSLESGVSGESLLQERGANAESQLRGLAGQVDVKRAMGALIVND